MDAILNSSVVYVQLSNCMLTALQCKVIGEVIKSYPHHELKLDLSQNPVYFDFEAANSRNIFKPASVNDLKSLVQIRSESRFLSFNISPTLTNINTSSHGFRSDLILNLISSVHLREESSGSISFFDSSDPLNDVIIMDKKYPSQKNYKIDYIYGVSDKKKQSKK